MPIRISVLITLVSSLMNALLSELQTSWNGYSSHIGAHNSHIKLFCSHYKRVKGTQTNDKKKEEVSVQRRNPTRFNPPASHVPPISSTLLTFPCALALLQISQKSRRIIKDFKRSSVSVFEFWREHLTSEKCLRVRRRHFSDIWRSTLRAADAHPGSPWQRSGFHGRATTELLHR